MWRDSYYSAYQRGNYLKSLGILERSEMKSIEIVEQELNPYIHRLQKRYHEIIWYDKKRLDEIQLTGIDLLVMQENAPFPAAVPAFPLLTTDYKLDYAKRIKSKNGS